MKNQKERALVLMAAHGAIAFLVITELVPFIRQRESIVALQLLFLIVVLSLSVLGCWRAYNVLAIADENDTPERAEKFLQTSLTDLAWMFGVIVVLIVVSVIQHVLTGGAFF